jgi:hypothetical protein
MMRIAHVAVNARKLCHVTAETQNPAHIEKKRVFSQTTAMRQNSPDVTPPKTTGSASKGSAATAQ